jgi:hypothetical protein
MRRYPPPKPRVAVANPTSWNGQRNRTEQARFRKRVLAAAGNQCQWVDHNGRCPITSPLQAHHDGHQGVALCRTHHKAIDAYAR